MTHHHRDLAADTEALGRLVRGLERIGRPLDTGTIRVLAGFVSVWPDSTTTTNNNRETVRRLTATGLKQEVIADRLGIGRSVVSVYAGGIPKKTGRGHRVPPETVARITALAAHGMPQRQIAAQVGVNQGTISRLLRSEATSEAA